MRESRIAICPCNDFCSIAGFPRHSLPGPDYSFVLRSSADGVWSSPVELPQVRLYACRRVRSRNDNVPVVAALRIVLQSFDLIQPSVVRLPAPQNDVLRAFLRDEVSVCPPICGEALLQTPIHINCANASASPLHDLHTWAGFCFNILGR